MPTWAIWIAALVALAIIATIEYHIRVIAQLSAQQLDLLREIRQELRRDDPQKRTGD